MSNEGNTPEEIGGITGTRTVLLKADDIEDGGDLQPLFRAEPDEGNERKTLVYLDRQVWHDLGAPEVITVDITVGDRLNTED